MRSGKLQERALWIIKFIRTLWYFVRRSTDETRNPPLIGDYPRFNFPHSYSQEQSRLRRKPAPTTKQRRCAIVAVQIHSDHDWHHLR